MKKPLPNCCFSVIDANPRKAGKLFTSKLIELALCSIPGFCIEHQIAPAKPRIVHFPALIDKKFLQQIVNVNDEKFYIDEVTYIGKEVKIKKQLPDYDFSFEKRENE